MPKTKKRTRGTGPNKKDPRIYCIPTEGERIMIETAATGRSLKVTAWLRQVAVEAARVQLMRVHDAMQTIG